MQHIEEASLVAAFQHEVDRVSALEEAARSKLAEQVNAIMQERERELANLPTPQLLKEVGGKTDCVVSRKALVRELVARRIHDLRESNELHHRELEAPQALKSELEEAVRVTKDLELKMQVIIRSTNDIVGEINRLAALLEL